jgi:hypothetical protein
MANTYSKYCPNVFVAKCQQQYEKGDFIFLETKHGKEHECIVHNFLYSRDGFYYYSITRADGFDAQERALAKAERFKGYAKNAEKRANIAYEKSREGEDFRALAEPIKVGHHSERRHRALYERVHNAFGRFVEESKNAEKQVDKASYWEQKAEEINLSMPESIDYYTLKLEHAKERHEGIKSGKYPREHSFSLTYAKKAVNEAEKNLQIAKKLWA